MNSEPDFAIATYCNLRLLPKTYQPRTGKASEK